MAASVPDSPGGELRARRYASPVRLSLPFKGDVLARAALVVLVLLLVASLLAPVLPAGDPSAVDVGPRLAAPSWSFPLGTDHLGRSLLPRVLEGIRVTVLLASGAVVVTSMLGVIIGISAAYFRGAVDEGIVRLADVMFSFPALLLAVLLAGIIGPGTPAAIVSIIIITLPLMVRVIRAASLITLERDFILAAEIAGASRRRIMFVHVLSNISGAAVVQATYAISVGVLVESTLSFLGLGVQPPGASLGSLLKDGIIYLPIAPWLVFAPGLVLAMVIFAVNLLGDGLRDTLDPQEARALQ
jgi:peptide/nickel transport system permease protein